MNRAGAWLGFVALAVAAGAVACSHRGGDTAEPERRFVETVYNNADTETFTRDAHHLSGTIVNRHETVTYRAALTPDGFISAVDVTARGRGEVIRRLYPVPKGTMPIMAGSTAFVEQILRRARVVGGDSISIPTILLGGTSDLNVMTLVSNGPDSLMLIDQAGDPALGFHLAIDSVWHITGGIIPASGMRIRPL
jgi:hypothetical protein